MSFALQTLTILLVVAVAHGKLLASVRASDPSTYSTSTGGGYWADGVSEVHGSNFSCGGFVSYLLRFESNDWIQETPRVLRFRLRFSADSEKPGIGLSRLEKVSINVGDPSLIRKAPKTVVSGSARQEGDPYLRSIVDVGNVRSEEIIIVRFDVKLSCEPATSPRGSLEATLESVEDTTAGETVEILSGLETVYLNGVEESSGINQPSLILMKTVAPAGGACGRDDAKSITAHKDETITHCYSIANEGTRSAVGVGLRDDSGTQDTTEDDVVFDIPDATNSNSSYSGTAILLAGSRTTIERRQLVTGRDRVITNTATLYHKEGDRLLTIQDETQVEYTSSPVEPKAAISSCACSETTIINSGLCQSEISYGICAVRQCTKLPSRVECDLGGKSICDLVRKEIFRCQSKINSTHCNCEKSVVVLPLQRQR